MQNITQFVEAKLKLVVNRQKSKAAHLSDCAFLGFQIRRGRIVWTEKALKRFRERIQEITSRSRGVSMRTLLLQLRRYVVGWLNYFGISQAYREIPELDQWLGGVCGCATGNSGNDRARGEGTLSGWESIRPRCTKPPAVTGATGLWPPPALCSERWTIAGSRNGECRTSGNDGSKCITAR